MKLYFITAICSALILLVCIIVNLDVQMPYYGLEAFRASDAWKWTQILSTNFALPFSAGASLVVSIIGMVVAHLTVKQPSNQLSQPTQPALQPPIQQAQLVQPTFTTDTTDDEWDGHIDRPDDAVVMALSEPLEPGDLSHAIKRAVMVTGDCGGDMAVAAERMNVSYEAVRKSVAAARKAYPDWTNWHVPPKGR